MKLKRRSRILILCVLLLALAGAMLALAGAVKNALYRERVAAAQTVEVGFRKGLAETFGSMNYAAKLAYAIDLNHTEDLELFQKNAQRLMEGNEHVSYVAYFKGDTLEYLSPADRFGPVLGRDMADFAYSVTLAKFSKTPVVEGPSGLYGEESDVFLFLQPICLGGDYVAEVVVAMDSGYVLSTLGLTELEDGNYDYELWRLDFLGQTKTVISTSDPSLDYSDAVKHEFSLPATWNISIMPKGGWVTRTERALIDGAFLVFGLVLLLAGVLLYRTVYLRRKLLVAKYTNADSGLATMEGFFFFVNRRLSKEPNVHLCVLELQLGNFRRFTKNMERGELVTYLMRFRQSLLDCLPEDTVATRLNDDSFLLAVFTDGKKPDRMIADFILQLHWKRRLDGQKIFITPRYCTVTYPEDGRDALSLVQAASRKFEMQSGNEAKQRVKKL